MRYSALSESSCLSRCSRDEHDLVPTWVAYAAAVAMLLPMIVVAVSRGNELWRRFERIAEFGAVGIALAFNSANLFVAAYNLVENPGKLEPVPLFYTSVGIWTGNILIFTLIYWLVDRGGPDARLNLEPHYPDFDFPAMNDPAEGSSELAARDHRLPLLRFHDVYCVQSDGGNAALRPGEAAHGHSERYLADHDRDRGRADDQYSKVALSSPMAWLRVVDR